jgi:hypothetical protein
VSGAPPPDGETADGARSELQRRCDAVEESYEYMLAYAAQGLASDQASPSGAQVREALRRIDGALDGLADLYRSLIARDALAPADAYRAFLDVLARDADDARASVRLVLAQPSIGSQLVDNLNASIHVRALLTDLFLIDELITSLRRS